MNLMKYLLHLLPCFDFHKRVPATDTPMREAEFHGLSPFASLTLCAFCLHNLGIAYFLHRTQVKTCPFSLII